MCPDGVQRFLAYTMHCYRIVWILTGTCILYMIVTVTSYESADLSVGRACGRVYTICISYNSEQSRSKLGKCLALGKSSHNYFAHEVGDVYELCACTRWCRWCLLLGTWYAWLGSICPHVQVGMCEVAFVIRCSHTCGDTRVDVFVSAVALHVCVYTHNANIAASQGSGSRCKRITCI